MVSEHMVLLTRADNLKIGCNAFGVDLKRLEHKIDLISLFFVDLGCGL
jgi:hypothetical protein